MRPDRLRRLALAVMLAAIGAWSAAPASATIPPAGNEAAPYVSSLVPAARVVGGGRLTWLGFHAYDAVLYAANARFAENAPFALELTYARKFTGAAIAERSIVEIRKLGLAEERELADWQSTLAGLFPDVAPGDRLTGVSQADGTARFFHNGRALGSLNDERLRRAFFSIWLDPRTSAPDLRRKLLGDSGQK
jgi:hypothetical protein